ncbi:MAG: OprD family porin [Pseudomonas sp.]|nr:OprD family porin [Pseudomonas sp.]
MQMMKWSVMALAIAAATSQLAVASSQSDSKGFVEDSSFDIFSRALYMNRDFKNGASTIEAETSGRRNGYAEETGLGIQGLFESGFTQGTIGFGVDAHTLSSIRLDTGRGRTGLGQFGVNGDGQAEETQTEVGGAVKARLSDSVLKYGNQMTASPVFATDDSRILPEVATGTLITSNEIEGLELSAGRFTAMSAQEYTGRDSINGPGEQGLVSANIAGISYSFNDNFSAAVHASDVEDYWTKKYLNLNYTVAVADDQSLNFDFNYYRTKDQGLKLGDEMDNQLWSVAPAYTIGAHTFTVAYQRSTGDTGYDYGVDGGSTVFVANSVQYSDFIGEQERSWQARYDLDMTSYGVAGLSFMTRYVRGTDIRVVDDADFESEGKENEFNFETKYVFQDGAAKDLSLRLRSAIYRANGAYNGDDNPDNNDVRLIAEYPLSIL